MRKVIAAINMTVDNMFDHTAVDPDEEVHRHYADLLRQAGVVLYGRITYQLMTYWKTMVQEPSGNEAMDDFAVVMDQVPKIVFSHTLQDAGWESATLANRALREEVLELKQQAGKDILVGSRSLILQLLKLGLIDECQFCIHPVLAGRGQLLFENIGERISLRLLDTKTFASGAIILYYEPAKSHAEGS